MLSIGSKLIQQFESFTKSNGTSHTLSQNRIGGFRTKSSTSTPPSSFTHPQTEPNLVETMSEYLSVREYSEKMTARRVAPPKGKWLLLAGVMTLFSSIYFYSIWKVGQDDFSDVDEFGNVREKV